MTAGESYTLVVDTGWPDAEGVSLKEEFRRQFTAGPADTTPLDPETWRLRVPGVGTSQRLVVSFAEPLDYGMMQRGLLVENASGQMVAGRGEATNWETRWSFVPDQPWQAGRYALVALSNLEDLAGNQIGVPFEINPRLTAVTASDQDVYRVSFEVEP